MTQEEKAKRYDEALKTAKTFYDKRQPISGSNIIVESIFPELKEESKDERIRKALIDGFTVMKESKNCGKTFSNHDIPVVDILNWLEKQEQKPNNVYDKELSEILGRVICRYINDPNISYTEREKVSMEIIPYVERLEKQGEQNPFDYESTNIQQKDFAHKYAMEAIKEEKVDNANKDERKFKIGDWIVFNGLTLYVKDIVMGFYRTISIDGIPNSYDWDIDNVARLWTIQDAKDGDVLACNEEILLFKSYSVQGRISLYCWYNGQTNNFHNKEVVDTLITTRNKICPATKEQRDFLLQKMKEAGYEWNAEKKELKKIDEEVNGDDYGIDSLYHAQRILEQTLGSVDWYQSDDGILEHKCAISAVKKLYEQKSTDEEMKTLLQTEYEKGRADAIAEKSWSEDDEEMLKMVIKLCEQCGNEYAYYWLKSLKDRVHPHCIEKACFWLKSHYRDYMHNPTGERLEAFFGGDMCNDFKIYMKGE